MKKIITKVLVVMFTFSSISFIQIDDIDSTSGMLKQKTVIKCKGKYYGKHAKGKKAHWHRAKKSKKNKKWYASGKNLGKSKPKVCRR